MVAVGDFLGECEIIAPLGAGGMANLFLGRRAGVSGFFRYVAVKAVHPHLVADEQFVRMFIDEAKICSQIQHPNVVHVEELGFHEGVHYLLMEFVHGTTLNQVIAKLSRSGRRMTPPLATYVAMQVADGLHSAHETRGGDGEFLGIVHRDVSPSNVMLAYKGHVKLIDFGVAKARGRQAEATAVGGIKGKVGYMAREQALGEDIDRRTDVFALGIVLWEMLTGRRLFTAASDVEVYHMVLDPQIVPPSQINRHVSPELEEVIMSALSVDRDRRPSSASELRRMLANAVPEAHFVDATGLSAMLQQTMAEELLESRQKLAELSVASLAAIHLPNQADAKPMTMQLSAEEVQRLSMPLPKPAPPPMRHNSVPPRPSVAPPPPPPPKQPAPPSEQRSAPPQPHAPSPVFQGSPPSQPSAPKPYFGVDAPVVPPAPPPPSSRPSFSQQHQAPPPPEPFEVRPRASLGRRPTNAENSRVWFGILAVVAAATAGAIYFFAPGGNKVATPEPSVVVEELEEGCDLYVDSPRGPAELYERPHQMVTGTLPDQEKLDVVDTQPEWIKIRNPDGYVLKRLTRQRCN